MPLLCPLKGCQAESGLCIHDKMLMGIAILIVIYSLLQAINVS